MLFAAGGRRQINLKRGLLRVLMNAFSDVVSKRAIVTFTSFLETVTTEFHLYLGEEETFREAHRQDLGQPWQPKSPAWSPVNCDKGVVVQLWHSDKVLRGLRNVYELSSQITMTAVGDGSFIDKASADIARLGACFVRYTGSGVAAEAEAGRGSLS